MKILIIDIPCECKLNDDNTPKYYLKVIPQKKTPKGSEIYNDYVRGYNDCIDDILGGLYEDNI